MPFRLSQAIALGALVALALQGPLGRVPAATGPADPAFRSPSGNEWWVQVHVDTSRSLEGVDARVGEGPWEPLALKSWGAWAASRHAPEGSIVQFRARSAAATTHLSDCYRWTSATLVTCSPAAPPAGNGVRFTHGGGNEWWVEAAVKPHPQRVEARDDGGAWVTLTWREWGEWAGSFHVEPGNRVRFRALLDGAWHESCWHAHPAGTPVGCAGATPTSPAPPGNGTRRLVAIGDTGTSEHTRANVQRALDASAQGLLGLGDYYYDDAPQNWKTLFRPLLDRGAFLVLGNHDALTSLAEHLPQGATWSREVSGARIVGLDTMRPVANGSEQYLFARRELCDAAEPMRVLVLHAPWWLLEGARHPASEFPGSPHAMDRLVAECGVDLVLASHEHNYQRLMRGEVAYVIVGTGGQSVYPIAGTPHGTVASHAKFGHLLLDVNATGYRAGFHDTSGTRLDAFAGTSHARAEVPPPPAPTLPRFTHRGGNEWWVEVVVSPTPAAVEAMETGGAWATLSARTWGAWAGSVHVEPGREVRFRALLDGAWQESCWHAHPSGVARCNGSAPAPTPSVTFSDASGNEWWEQVVARAGEPVGSVDVSINGGAWKPLALRSWGAWAASYHAPAGSQVVFRATLGSGATAQSPPYAWPPS